MLAPLAVGAEHIGQGIGATIGYLAFYAVMNLGAFAVVHRFAAVSEENLLEDYRGLARRNPLSGFSLAFFLICLAGLPPGVMGLVAKVLVFKAVVTGPVLWLAAVMAVNVVIGLYYYLVWAARLFAPGTGLLLPSGASYRMALGVTGAGAVLLSVAPQVLLQVVFPAG
jgi:NADH-quinone oxidoreductase subunit N